jgi:hypothetical protein
MRIEGFFIFYLLENISKRIVPVLALPRQEKRGGGWYSPGIPRYHYRPADGNDFTVIAAGSDHIMALTSDGKAFDWDWPVGDFPFDYFDRPVPPDVVFTKDIDGGFNFSAALRLP